MYLEIQERVRERFAKVVQEMFAVAIAEPVLDIPPRPEMGDLSISSCFELARQLRQPPQKIAEQVLPRLLPLEGVERASVAGGGYVNLHLDRAGIAAALFSLRSPRPATQPSSRGKILIEHTSINPNKAAHIGHLRNAVLGDTFVRLWRFRGDQVEVQNYIDNTGVQVADVVVGFVHVEKKSAAEVERLLRDPAVRFDYFCWDLYARVSQLYEQDKEMLALRLEALKAIEEGRGEMAKIAALVSTAIVRKHLETMRRVNVAYDLLVQESEILRLDFWKCAFELLKRRGAIRYETSGKNSGCWVMSLEEAGPGEAGQEIEAEEVKIIVRSNGTATYVGKDIAYHLWKFALLDKDFGFEEFHRYPDGHTVWRTAVDGRPGAPAFGRASVAYSVIDTRQSYLQKIVGAAFRALNYPEQAANLHHFAYEVVGLSPRCAEELGIKLSADERERSYVEVSGRRGLGIKADDLIDVLFDLKEAMTFEGETGPYLQYSVVRGRNIFRKYRESHPELSPGAAEDPSDLVPPEQLNSLLSGESGQNFWELVVLAAQLETIVEQAIATAEPSVLAKHVFRLAQAFNNFYHRYHILSEPDPARQNFLLCLVRLASDTLSRSLDLMGIEVPPHM
ncbi:MAG: arginine--tRNA ligase [Acidobacteria bacterium]|nr:MAG: arginine--tRNA ligase [Acidobacteriota bacterium]